MARWCSRTVGDLGCEVEIEPGRLIAGNAGLLVAKTIYRKEGEGRDFLILDAAMNDLIRPAMYDAWHDILPVKEPGPDDPVAPVDIVGPVCESGDTFAKQRDMAFGEGRGAGRLPLRRRLWRGYVVRIQQSAADPRGSGERLTV